MPDVPRFDKSAITVQMTDVPVIFRIIPAVGVACNAAFFWIQGDAETDNPTAEAAKNTVMASGAVVLEWKLDARQITGGEDTVAFLVKTVARQAGGVAEFAVEVVQGTNTLVAREPVRQQLAAGKNLWTSSLYQVLLRT